ncbi:MAG TPA: ABC transporter family substrate-binding protein, partial [Nocardioidaceae bacterium]|nr:ABC transporter family substrate-binding protein [Nocardioidaceae bacterium]
VIASLSLGLTACGGTENTDNQPTDDQPTTLTIGWNQSFYSYNDATLNGNNTTNANIAYLTNSQFNYYTPDNVLTNNDWYGSYEKVSDDPLTVTYTINDGVNWSDGTPVDAADLMLAYGVNSGNFNTTAEVKYDENTGVASYAEGEVFFNSAAASDGISLNLVKETPVISDDGKSITLVYSKPYADWNLDYFNSIRTPAHIVGKKALGETDAQAAKDAVVAAFEGKDKAALSEIAAFWNVAYDFADTPSDPELIISNGPYRIKEAKADEYVTLERNPEYTGPFDPNIDELTVRFISDPVAAIQALQNGEVDMYEGQATADSVDSAEAAGIEMEAGEESTYEHIDLTIDNGGPFDPKSYDGDEAKAKLVRQAFLAAYPRQEIIDTIIKPMVPDAQLRTALVRFPGAPGYDEASAANGHEAFGDGTADIQKAKDLLAEAGVTKPKVVLMYDNENPRRADEFALVSATLTEAGFNIVDKGTSNWSSFLGNKKYDAVFFGWQDTSSSVFSSAATWLTTGGSNYQGFSSEVVDAAYGELAGTTDEAKQIELLTTIDTEIFSAAVSLPIFQFPGVVFYNAENVTNLDPAYLAPTMFYNYWEWEVVS